MEEKLEQFKRRRRKEVFLNKGKLIFRGIMGKLPGLSPLPVSEANSPVLDNAAQNQEVGSTGSAGSADSVHSIASVPSVRSCDSSNSTESTESINSYNSNNSVEIEIVVGDQFVEAARKFELVLTVITFICYFILWILILLYAVHFEFGIIYIIFSALVLLYLSTRTEPKKKYEISAYSVFNPDCESIDGTLSAEDFEKELNLIKH